MVHSYDVIVIGCGSAGSRAASAAAAVGARTLAIEGAERIGGLCILRGCMPTKALLETAHRAHEIREAHRFGIRAGEPEIDFAAQMQRMRALVDRFRAAKQASIEGGAYDLVRGKAVFTGAHSLDVGGETYEAGAFVLANGSKVRPMFAPEGVRILTSDDMFELEAPPQRALVLGGGAVGLEFALWLARNGTHVTLSVRSQLLHRVDPEIGAELTEALAEEMEVLVPSLPCSFQAHADGVTVELDLGDGQRREVRVDAVLNATGRVPDFDGLEIDRAGLELERGWLTSNDFLQTGQEHVFVAGDARGRRLILHEANREGLVAGTNAARAAGVAKGSLETLDDAVPDCEVIFTDPAFASVGKSIVDCERDGIPFRHADKGFPAQGRGIITGARYGRVRLVAHAETGKVLGCQILNARADDLIHIPAAAITMEATVADMYRIPWYHPTLAEAFIEVCRELLRPA